MLDWHSCQICYSLEIKILLLLLLLLTNTKTLSILLSEAIQTNDNSHDYDCMRGTLNYITYVTSHHSMY